MTFLRRFQYNSTEMREVFMHKLYRISYKQCVTSETIF